MTSNLRMFRSTRHVRRLHQKIASLNVELNTAVDENWCDYCKIVDIEKENAYYKECNDQARVFNGKVKERNRELKDSLDTCVKANHQYKHELEHADCEKCNGKAELMDKLDKSKSMNAKYLAKIEELKKTQREQLNAKDAVIESHVNRVQSLEGANAALAAEVTAALHDVGNQIDCVVCRDRPRNIVHFPCKHIVQCEECVAAQPINMRNTCPVCQVRVKSHKKVYMA